MLGALKEPHIYTYIYIYIYIYIYRERERVPTSRRKSPYILEQKSGCRGERVGTSARNTSGCCWAPTTSTFRDSFVTCFLSACSGWLLRWFFFILYMTLLYMTLLYIRLSLFLMSLSEIPTLSLFVVLQRVSTHTIIFLLGVAPKTPVYAFGRDRRRPPRRWLAPVLACRFFWPRGVPGLRLLASRSRPELASARP